jgi:hypothetical protein
MRNPKSRTIIFNSLGNMYLKNIQELFSLPEILFRYYDSVLQL